MPIAAQYRSRDLKIVRPSAQPTEEEMRRAAVCLAVCKHVKSNAIVYARDGQTVGVGAGQMSRVDAARFGAMKAVLPLRAASPPRMLSSLSRMAWKWRLQRGATAVIQPGGSVRDAEVIAAADRLGVAMVFTGMRHFRH